MGVGAAPWGLLKLEFRSFKPCSRQTKQTNAQALKTSSKTNAREYATANIKTLATTTWKWCQYCKSSRRCRRQDTTKISKNPHWHAIFCNFSLSCSASVRLHVEVRHGYDRTRGVGAAPRRRRSNEAIWQKILVPRIAYWSRDEKKLLNESPKKTMITYIFIFISMRPAFDPTQARLRSRQSTH